MKYEKRSDFIFPDLSPILPIIKKHRMYEAKRTVGNEDKTNHTDPFAPRNCCENIVREISY